MIRIIAALDDESAQRFFLPPIHGCDWYTVDSFHSVRPGAAATTTEPLHLFDSYYKGDDTLGNWSRMAPSVWPAKNDRAPWLLVFFFFLVASEKRWRRCLCASSSSSSSFYLLICSCTKLSRKRCRHIAPTTVHSDQLRPPQTERFFSPRRHRLFKKNSGRERDKSRR